jgi:hypothetical protein
MPRSPITTEAMPSEAIQAVQKAADIRVLAMKKAGAKLVESLVKVPPSALYLEGSTTATDILLSSDFNGDDIPELGDRVVNLCANGIPFGVRGTVVGIHDPSSGCVEVVMDEEFVGGGNLQGSCSNFRGKLCVWSHLLKVNPEDSKLSVEKLLVKKSGKIVMDKIFAAVEKQGISAGNHKIEVNALNVKSLKLGLKSKVNPPPKSGLQEVTDDNEKSQNISPNSASRRCGDSSGRTRQAGWKEALGPSINGIGFTQRRSPSSGYERWQNQISQTTGFDVIPSPDTTCEVGVMTSISAESAQDATSGLKALLGIPTTSSSSSSTDSLCDHQTSLGLTTKMSSAQKVSENHQDDLSSAADRLLRMMNAEHNRISSFPTQMFTPSSFNFTYIEGGDNHLTASPKLQSHRNQTQIQKFELSGTSGKDEVDSLFSSNSLINVNHGKSSHEKSNNESTLPDGAQAIIPSSVFLKSKR